MINFMGSQKTCFRIGGLCTFLYLVTAVYASYQSHQTIIGRFDRDELIARFEADGYIREGGSGPSGAFSGSYLYGSVIHLRLPIREGIEERALISATADYFIEILETVGGRSFNRGRAAPPASMNMLFEAGTETGYFFAVASRPDPGTLYLVVNIIAIDRAVIKQRFRLEVRLVAEGFESVVRTHPALQGMGPVLSDHDIGIIYGVLSEILFLADESDELEVADAVLEGDSPVVYMLSQHMKGFEDRLREKGAIDEEGRVRISGVIDLLAEMQFR